MPSIKVLARGRVTIPKTLRELLGINEGDELVIQADRGRIVMSKKRDVYHIFSEVAERKGKKMSVKDIKRGLDARYEGT